MGLLLRILGSNHRTLRLAAAGLIVASALIAGWMAAPNYTDLFAPSTDAMLKSADQSLVTILVKGKDFAGSGSGFVIDNRGHVLTNAHVMTDAWLATAIGSDGYQYGLKLLSLDTATDVAELEVGLQGLKLSLEPGPPPLTLAHHGARVGERVYILGNPRGTAPNTVIGVTARVGAQTQGLRHKHRELGHH